MSQQFFHALIFNYFPIGQLGARGHYAEKKPNIFCFTPEEDII